MITRAKLSTVKQGMPAYRSMLAGNSTYWAFESIASATGTGSSGTITFSSIPSTYQSLQVRVLGRSTGGTDTTTFTLQYNSTAMTNFHSLRGNGATVAALNSNVPVYIPATNVAANVMGVAIIDIDDYASTTRNKTARYFGGWDGNNVHTTNERISLSSSFLDNTAAITSISLVLAAGSWSTNSTFALYGIKGA